MTTINCSALTPRLRHQFAILADAGFPIPDPSGARVLDLGCGEGNAVRTLRAAGYDALGCDVKFGNSAQTRELIDAGLVRAVPMQPYGLPFDDAMFDVVLSNEVFEHVQNYAETVAELFRVMKPGGVSLHIFPARWIPIEPHVGVPLATIVRNYPWLRFWAAVGVRNHHQHGMSAAEVARANQRYLTSSTNYLPGTEIRKHFGRAFAEVRFAEDLFLKNSKRGRYIHAVARVAPFLLSLYRGCWNRVIVTRK